MICQFRGIGEKDPSLCVIYWDNPFLSIQNDSSGLIPCWDVVRNGSWEIQLNSNHLIQIQVINDSLYRYYLDLFDYNDYYSYNDSIRKYVPILHCYQLTLEDLQQVNWTVVYTGEE